MTNIPFSQRFSGRGSSCVVAFVAEPLKIASVGNRLVEQLFSKCLASKQQAAPRLLILWATHHFAPFETLLQDINDSCERLYGNRIPLIGATVSGCMFDGKAYRNGAILFSLNSSDLNVNTKHVEIDDPRESAKSILRQLNIIPTSCHAIQPERQLLMLFVAGYGVGNDPRTYRAAEFVDGIRTITHQRFPLFGGVSSIDSSGSRIGCQFIGNTCSVNTSVAAFLSFRSPLTTGMCHGLVPVRGSMVSSQRDSIKHHFKQPESSVCYIPHGSVIGRRAIYSESLRDIVTNTSGKPMVLRARGGRDDVLYVPRLEGEAIVFQRDVEDEIVLEALVPKSTELSRSVLRLEKRLSEKSGINRKDVDLLMSIGCTARFQWAEGMRFDKWVESVERRFVRATHVGCFMDGEIGTDENGMPSLSNWSLSEAMLSNDKPAPPIVQVVDSFWRRPVRTVSDAVDLSLLALKRMGYCGGMTSLIYDGDGTTVIVAKKAFGEFWDRFVLPRTQRSLSGTDVLATAVKKMSYCIIPDATTDPHCDRDAARMANIHSFVAFPLIDPSRDQTSNQVLAIVQVDLGDRRHLETVIEDRELVEIKYLAAALSGVMANAFKADWLHLEEKLNRALFETDKDMDADDFATSIVAQLVDILGASGAHVRLLRNQKLVLAGKGHGSYYKVACRNRAEIDPTTDLSPSAACFRRRRPVLRNNVAVESNELSDEHRFLKSEGESCIGRELQKLPAFGCIPIVEDESCPPLGVISFSSNKPWSFQQIQVTRLAQVARRFAFVLRRIGAQRALSNRNLPEAGRITEAREALTVGGSTPGW